MGSTGQSCALRGKPQPDLVPSALSGCPFKHSWPARRLIFFAWLFLAATGSLGVSPPPPPAGYPNYGLNFELWWPVATQPTNGAQPPNGGTVDFTSLGTATQTFTIPKIECDMTWNPNCNPPGVVVQFAARFTGTLSYPCFAALPRL